MMSGSFSGEQFKGMLSTVQSSVGSVMESLSAISPFKAVGGAIGGLWDKITGGGDDTTAEKPLTPEELNKALLEKIDELITAVRENGGGDILLDGQKVGKQIATSTTSPVRG